MQGEGWDAENRLHGDIWGCLKPHLVFSAATELRVLSRVAARRTGQPDFCEYFD
jgi:hypothetical protein